MKVKDIYKGKDKRTIEYMENVVSQIESDYKAVPASWRVSLDLIADTLDIYFAAVDDIKKRGIFAKDDKGRPSKNQACAIQNVCLQNIQKLLAQFGLTPMSKSKLRDFKGKEDENELLNDLLEV